jgi:hypothetical protein
MSACPDFLVSNGDGDNKKGRESIPNPSSHSYTIRVLVSGLFSSPGPVRPLLLWRGEGDWLALAFPAPSALLLFTETKYDFVSKAFGLAVSPLPMVASWHENRPFRFKWRKRSKARPLPFSLPAKAETKGGKRKDFAASAWGVGRFGKIRFRYPTHTRNYSSTAVR